MTPDFLEYGFLSSCYLHGISEKKVYQLFIERVFSELVFSKIPFMISISKFQKYILDKYKIEIPPMYIKSIIKSLQNYNSDFIIKKEEIIFQWDMKRDGIPVLRGKRSKFIFIQMKERVNQNRFKVQNIAVNVRGSLL